MNASDAATLKVALYTPYAWDRSITIVRALGPLSLAGIQVLQGNDWDARQVYPERVLEADLVLIQRDFPRLQEAYRAVLTQARQAGKQVIYEVDDLLIELPKDHPDQAIHYYTDAMVPMIQATIEADALTVSSAALAEYLRPYNPNIWLLPNFLDDHLWKIRAPEEQVLLKADRPVVIGFMGGDSHRPDLQMIAPALLRIFDQLGEGVVFRLWGCQPPDELAGLLQVDRVPFVPDYAHYARQALDFQCDLAVAPLVNNLFNRSKSSIKALEYFSLAIPTIFSRIEPFEQVVIDGKNGLLAGSLDEWQAKLASLIADPALRLRLAQEAHLTLVKNWRLSQNAHRWKAAYQEILALPTRPAEPVFMERLLHQVSELQREADEWSTGEKVRWLEEKADYLEKLSQEQAGQLASQSKQIQQQRAQLETVQNLARAQQAQIAEKDQLIQSQSGWIAEMKASRAYRLVQALWRLRLWLAPHGSRRVRLARLAFRSPQVLIKEGPAPFGQAVRRKLKPFFSHNRLIEEKPVERGVQIDLSGLGEDPRSQLPETFDVIVLPIIDWEFRFQRPQQLSLQLAQRGHRVFYFRTNFPTSHTLSIRKLAPVIFEGSLPAEAGLNLYHDQLSSANQQTMLGAFHLLAESFSIKEAVILVDLPFWTPLALALRSQFGWKVVYDCMDFHGGFATNTEQMVQAEPELSRSADLVVTTSRFLLEQQSTHNQNCVLIPNAADYAHFSSPPALVPPKVQAIPHPIIGFYGAISERFDADLVAWLAQERPTWQFVLLGNTAGADLTALTGLENIHFFGETPYAELPAYLHQFDVCIIPFKKIPLVLATNPVKLYEYFAAGKPVVATALDELRLTTDLARLAATPQEWLAGIEASLAEDGENSPRRKAFAAQNSWKARTDHLSGALNELYPQASLIILTYNNLPLTKQCLDSIYQSTLYPNFEVVVVDNASTDGTQEYLRGCTQTFPNLKLALNSENRGFAGGMNQGIQISSGEIVVLMNNDVVVSRGWLGTLVRHLQNDPELGMIGPVTNATGNEARIEVPYQELDQMPAFADQYTLEHANQVYPLREFAMYTVALRRRVIDEIGPLDERFIIGMFEDDDYAMRLRAAGYKILVAQDAFVHHHNLSAFKTLPEDEYLAIFEENKKRYNDKWQVEWSAPQKVSASTLIEGWSQVEKILKRHPDRKGVIILPPTIGWSITLFQRPHQLARAFARLGYLTFFCERDFEAGGQLGFRELEPELYVGYSPLEVFDQIKEPIVLIYVYNKEHVHAFRKPTVVLDHVDDLEVFPFDQGIMQRNYDDLLRRAAVVVTTADRLYGQAVTSRPDALLVPNGVDFAHFCQGFDRLGEPPAGLAEVVAAGRPIIGYYGALARWFDYNLAAYAAQHAPEYSFVLIGPDHDGTLAASGITNLANIHWLGPRPYQSLPEYLAWFDVATIPFVVNEITRATSPIKLFEYLAAGKAVVTSDLPEGRKYFGTSVASTYEEFLQLLKPALEKSAQPEFRRQAQEEARRHDWEARAMAILTQVERARSQDSTKRIN